jgi:hypothetical protein
MQLDVGTSGSSRALAQLSADGLLIPAVIGGLVIGRDLRGRRSSGRRTPATLA